MRLEALTLNNFEKFATLMGGSEFGGCYCAVWRAYDDTWVKRCHDASKPNLKVTEDNLIKGFHIGFLAYENEEIIGWSGSGPKTEFPFLENKLGSRLTSFDSKTWSIGCIAVKASFRGKSKSAKMVTAVIKKAKEDGADSLEAYPTNPWDEPRSYRGSYQQYLRLGFKEFGSERDGDVEISCLRLKL